MKKLSKILVLVLALAMMFTMASMFTASAAEETRTIYLNAGGSGLWDQANAYFEAWTWGGSNPDSWVRFTDANYDGIYEAEIFADRTGMLILRKAPGDASENMDARWNKTGDITIGTDNCITITGWGESDFAWSTIEASSSTPVFTVAGVSGLCGTEWDVANTANDMTLKSGTVYEKVYTGVAAGSYEYKVAAAHSWTHSWSNGTATNGNSIITVADDNSTVIVTFDEATKTVSATAHVCSFSDATCTVAKTCSTCQATEGEALGHNMVAGEVVAPTYLAGGYTPYTCANGCGTTENRDLTDKLVPEFPEVVVTPAENPELTFALNFGIKDVDSFTEDYVDALLALYGDMYVDYRLTISGLTAEKVVFNANGEADGFLGGQYDAWSENWVYVPLENVEIPNGESLYIMEYAAKLMNKQGLRYTLAEVATIVVNFDCGVYFTPEFLAANPDMVVTLELIVFTEDEEGNKTLLNNEALATNVFYAPHEHTYTDATCTAPKTCKHCGATEGEALGHTWANHICYVCGASNPDYKVNAVAVGTHTLVCNQYHPVANGEGQHGKPWQNTYLTITESGKYVISTTSYLGITVFTTPITDTDPLKHDYTKYVQNTNGAIVVDLEPGVYYIGFVYLVGEGEYNITIDLHTEHSFEAGVCTVCGAEDPNYVPPHEHSFVEGKCECGETDPNYVPEQPPVDEPTDEPTDEPQTQPEPTGFAKIWAAILGFLNKILGFFKGLFVKG